MSPSRDRRPEHIRLIAWVALAGLLLAGGCAPWAGPRVRETAGGQYVVEVGRRVSFDELAERVYGDPRLGVAIAELNDLAYADGVPSGTLLVLPPKERLQGQVAEEKAAEEHFQEGLAAVDAGNFREGAERFREALRADPGRVDVLYNLGLALDGAGELEGATQALGESVRRRPDDPEIHYALGSVLRRRGAYESALEEFRAALEIDRGHSKAAFALARILEDLQRLDYAKEAWEDFLEKFPESPWVGRARENLQAVEEKRLEEEWSGP